MVDRLYVLVLVPDSGVLHQLASNIGFRAPSHHSLDDNVGQLRVSVYDNVLLAPGTLWFLITDDLMVASGQVLT